MQHLGIHGCVQPALAVYIVALSHAIRYIAPAPVVEYIDLIPAVSHVAPAVVVESVACSGFRYLSNIVPVVSLGFTIFIAHSLRDMFGVALGTPGTRTMGWTIDALSLISGSRGDIAEMSQLDEWVRGRADVLDAEGNTMVVIGKGFAIGSAGLVSLRAVRDGLRPSRHYWSGLPPQMGLHWPVVWRHDAV